MPTVLDMAANPATEGIAQRTLLDVCMDLFAKLEASLVGDRKEFIDGYFATLVKQDEMTMLWTEPAYYEHLRTVIQKEVLPLYDRYCAIRAKVLVRIERRSWPKYCLWAIGICLDWNCSSPKDACYGRRCCCRPWWWMGCWVMRCTTWSISARHRP